ncbi:MAG: thioredoxin family protein [Proteobacteria bacterium]|nr:thioredoxin family protein [Pseudomonadota bacterium]
MMNTVARLVRLGLSALLVLVAFVGAASAQDVFKSDQSRAAFIVDRTAVEPGKSIWVALELDMIPGWHTYWRTPGDSGLPAEIEWNLPEGVTAGPIQWPTPERIPFSDLMNFGYHDTVLLLTELRISDQVPAGELKINPVAHWLVCADICIPQDAALSLRLTVGPGGIETNYSEMIAASRTALPQPATWPANASVRNGILTITARPDHGDKVTGAVFFPYDEGVIVNAAPQGLEINNNELRLAIPTGEKAATVKALNGLLVVQAGGASAAGYEISAPIAAGAAASAPPVEAMSLALALLLAFAGGLVLNVMPCVLPVLVMKAMSFITRGAEDPGALKRDGLAYTAGVMVAFGVLVAALLALRAGSSAVGWGFQLQSPPFVATLAFIMLALGLSLSGVFTIGGSFGVGQSLTARGGASGSFFTGLLAVVVATPCTAPFMGAALGFALTQSPVMTVLIFEALALGLAFPYLVISFVPGVARRLPRPGMWMERVKQVLAFPLYGAAAWLVWVLSQQVDAAGFAVGLAGLVFVGFAAWLWGTAAMSGPRAQMWAKVTAVASIAIALASIAALRDQAPMTASTQAAAPATNYEAYSEARLAQLQAEGRPVFVNFTAAWCISCLVNEKVALSRPEVVAALKDQNVAYLKGDWTNRNAEIAGALHKLGRDGVPLYVLYSPKAEPKILPQVLTPSLVVEALKAL